MTYNQLGFAFVGLKTISFATIDAAYKKNGEINLISGLGFGLGIEDHTVTCNARFNFEKKKEQPFIILEIQAIFEIEKNDFQHKVKQEDNSYLVSKDLATHLAMLTVGSARGVLHAKTEGTVYNEFLLPTIDVKQMIPADVIFKF